MLDCCESGLQSGPAVHQPGDSDTDHTSKPQSFNFCCEKICCLLIIEVLLHKNSQHETEHVSLLQYTPS